MLGLAPTVHRGADGFQGGGQAVCGHTVRQGRGRARIQISETARATAGVKSQLKAGAKAWNPPHHPHSGRDMSREQAPEL